MINSAKFSSLVCAATLRYQLLQYYNLSQPRLIRFMGFAGLQVITRWQLNNEFCTFSLFALHP